MDPVCDLCGGLDIRWDWLTPNKLTVEQAEAGLGLYFEDPHWFICNPCHELVLADKRDVLYERAKLNMPVLPEAVFADPYMRSFLEDGQRAEVKRMHEAFWEYKTEFTAIEEA